MKVFIVEKHSDLNGISERELDIDHQGFSVLATSDIVVDEKKHFNIKKRAYTTDGSLILFVERSNTYPIDDDFIDYYFQSRIAE